MEAPIEAKIADLKKLSVPELQKMHKGLFEGQAAFSHNKIYLIRRIANRMQELEYGGLSEKALTRIKELIEKYDPINNKTLRPGLESVGRANALHSFRDKRLPIPGSMIVRKYKDSKIEVKVLEKGFEYNGKIYKSLTAVSKEVTGTNWNAFDFFKL